MEHVWANNATSRVAYATDAGSPTVTVETNDGEKFPLPSGAQFFMVTVEDRRTGQMEIMRCTSRSGDVLTVVRAQEGTPAQSFLVGATVSNRLTAGTLTDMVDFVNNSPGFTEEEADARFVNVAGDTMTGPLTLYGNPISTYMAATKNYVDMGLDGKASLQHTHPISDVVNLQTELDKKISDAPLDGQTYARQSGAWIVSVSKQDVIDSGVSIQGELTSIHQAIDDLTARVTMLENTKLSDAPDDGVMYGRQSKQWLAVNPGTSGVLISDTPPIVSGPGYLWLESNSGIMYARIRDIDSEQWVQVNNPPSVGSGEAGIPDAPADGNLYGRQNNAWAVASMEGYVGEAPVDGTPYNRQDAGWVAASVPLPPLPEAPNDGQTYTRGSLQWQVLTWNTIPNRPPSFPPSAHTHVIADTTGLQAALDTKEPKITGGTAGQYWNGLKQWTALPTPVIATDAPSDGADYVRINGTWGVMNWTNLDGKPTTFAPSPHTHPISEVVNLTAVLNGKEPTIAAGDATQYWRGDKSWQTLPPPGIADAPSDGLLYGRKDAAWIVAGISFPEAPSDGGHYFRQGSTASWTAGNWTNLAGKPATFPPSAHTHTASQITDLSTVMATKENLIAPGSINDYWRGDKTWQPTPVSFPEAPTDGLSYLRKGSTKTWEVGMTSVQGDNRYLPLTGGTITGDLSIVKAGPFFVLDKAASAQSSIILGRKGGSNRWAMYVGDNIAEGGSNAGSNFKLEAYTDAGSVLGTAFDIARSTQILDFKRTPTVNGAPMIGGAVISDTAPGAPVPGQFWWESDTGILFLRYSDPNSQQWVQVNAAGLPEAPNDANVYLRGQNAWRSSGTIAGALTVGDWLTVTGGIIAGYGYQCRTNGTTGPAGTNVFNFNWNGGIGRIEAWIDNYNAGNLAVTGDLGNYLPLTGGTISGALTMTGSCAANYFYGTIYLTTPGYITCANTTQGGQYSVSGSGSTQAGGVLGYTAGNGYYGIVGYNSEGCAFYGSGRIKNSEEVHAASYVRSLGQTMIAVGHPLISSTANAYMNSGGTLQRISSSTVYKDAIEPMEDAFGDKVLQLRPVFYRPKNTNDYPGWSRFGFIAEEVHAVDHRFAETDRAVKRDENGKTILARRPMEIPNPEHIAWTALPVAERGPMPEPNIVSMELYGEPEWDTEKGMEQTGLDLNGIVAALVNLVQRQETRIRALEAANV